MVDAQIRRLHGVDKRTVADVVKPVVAHRHVAGPDGKLQVESPVEHQAVAIGQACPEQRTAMVLVTDMVVAQVEPCDGDVRADEMPRPGLAEPPSPSG